MMKHFDDSEGTSWGVRVTYGDVVRVKRECGGFDLPGMFSDELAGLARLSEDFGLLVAVAYCLCESQATKIGVSPEEFGARFAGDALESARNAIVEATVDFFPDQRRRDALRELVAKLNKASARVMEVMTPAGLEQLDRAIDEMTAERLASWSNHSSGSAAGLSG